MNCKKCGMLLNPGDQICNNCGAMVEVTNQGVVENNPVNKPDLLASEQPVSSQPSNQNVFNQPVMSQTQSMPQQSLQNSGVNSYAQPVPKKSSKGIIIAILASLIIIALAAYVIFTFINEDEEKTNNNDNINNNVDEDNTADQESSNYKVNYGKFTFSIPDDYVYQVYDDCLAIGDEEGNFVVKIGVLEGQYSVLLTNKNQVKSNLVQGGYVSSDPVEKTINSFSYLTFEVIKGGNKSLLAYTKANSMYCFGIEIQTLSNQFDYSILEEFASILKSATFNQDNSSNLKPSDLNINIVEGLLE